MDEPIQKSQAALQEDGGGEDDVQVTLERLQQAQRGEAPAERRRPVWLTVLMIVFFPVTGCVLFFKWLARRIHLRITAKMTIVYTLMVTLVLLGFTVFILSGLHAQLPDSEEAGAYLRTLIITTTVLDVTFVVLFACVGAVSAQGMLRPIRTMTATIDEISGENLSARLTPSPAQDEVRELTLRINDMLDNLQESFERQQNFVADASHELKTPISVIQGYANLLKRWGKADPAVLEEGIDAIAREAENMKKIVEQLLLLARLGNLNLNVSAFDLVAAVSEVVDSYRLIDTAHSLVLSCDAVIPVKTDRNMLMESVRTLVDNAIKYTPAGGRIDIGCKMQGENAVITVADTGVGISPEDLPHIFERFYRCDKAHGREGGSNGLGLAIAQSIVKAMRGTLTAASTLGVGTTFTITLS